MFAQTFRPSINHKNLPNSSPRYMRNGDVISEATSILVLEVEGEPTEKRMYPWKIQGFLPEKKNGVKQKTTKIEQKTLGKYMWIFMTIAFGLVKLFLIFFGPNIWICLPTWSLSRSCHISNKRRNTPSPSSRCWFVFDDDNLKKHSKQPKTRNNNLQDKQAERFRSLFSSQDTISK